MAKKKKLIITLELPEEKYLKHIMDAYGLVSKYRQAQGVPHMNMEAWLTTVVVEGANAIFNFHNQQQAAIAKKKQEELDAQEEVKEESKEDGEDTEVEKEEVESSEGEVKE